MKRYQPTFLLIGTSISLIFCACLVAFSNNPLLLELAKACGLLTALGMLASVNAAWGVLSHESRTKKISESHLGDRFHKEVA